MQKISATHVMQIVQKIDSGIRDYVSTDSRFTPLWNHQFLRESLFSLLEHADSPHADFYQLNFRNVCAIMAPDFEGILDLIELPEPSLDIPMSGRHIDQRSRTPC
jgi:hypothetical protein